MCELYPICHSCCGVPVRIALIFIAVLSIVTGALINAGLKKAGVNVASIDDVKNIKKEDFAMKKQNSTLKPPTRRPRTRSTKKPRRTRTTKASLRALSEDETDAGNVIVVTPKRTTVGNTPRIRIIDGARGDPSTVEIVGEEPITESLMAEMNTKLLLRDSAEEESEESGEGEKETTKKPSSTEKPSSDNNDAPNDASNDASNDVVTSTTKKPTMDIIMRKVSSVNRNGINLLSCAFVALGILLLVANFTNSAELAILYVVLSVVNSIAALCLLIGIVSECAKNQQFCLLSNMDWFSGFILTLVWFVSIFIWLFFAAVANGMANGLTPHHLAE